VEVATVPTEVTVPVAVTPDAPGAAVLPAPAEEAEPLPGAAPPAEVGVAWPDPARPPAVEAAVEGVNVAGWPTASLLICVSSTFRLTTNDPVLMTSTSGDDEVPDAAELLAAPAVFDEADDDVPDGEAPDDDVPVRPEPVAVPFRPTDPPPVDPSCWPTVRLTTETVPLIGAVSMAPFSAD
jgi:hypothetical protein